MTSVSSILGSGWLFSAYYSAKLAGPNALLAWLIGAVVITILAFSFAEICASIPVSGFSTRLPILTHGTLCSFILSWIVWLSYMALTPTEVQAVVQYLAYFHPNITTTVGGLTHAGLLLALVLMAIISILNTYSLRWLIRINSVLTVIKLLIPLVIVVALLTLWLKHSHSMAHPSGHASFLASGFSGIMGAIVTGGIIYSFNGFKTAAELAGEAKSPGRAIPIAIVGSIALTTLVFLLLQTAFLSALTPTNLSGGWAHLHFLSSNNSPYTSLLNQHRLDYLIPLVYIGAIISPLAASMMYASSAARSLYGMSKEGNLPSIFQHLSPNGNPRVAIITNFIVGMLMFLPLPGWNAMVTLLTSLLVLSYICGPISLLVLRRNIPNLERPLKLPFPTLWSFSGVYICAILSYWSGFHTLELSTSGIIIGCLLFVCAKVISNNPGDRKLHIKESLWFWCYLLGIDYISYYSNYAYGPHLFSLKVAVLILIPLSGLSIFLANAFCLKPDEMKRHIERLLHNQHPIAESKTTHRPLIIDAK